MQLTCLLKILSVSSFVWLSSCATVEVPNFRAFITLPASEDGFGVYTVSHKEVTISREEWAQERKRGIVILPEDWKILKTTIRKNCIVTKCKQAIGALDGLFLAIDDALKKVGQ